MTGALHFGHLGPSGEINQHVFFANKPFVKNVLCSIFSKSLQCVMVLQAQYDASELITYREMVSQKITDELTKRSAHFGLILDDISIVSLFIGVYLSLSVD